jgi:hypothetical protein
MGGQTTSHPQPSTQQATNRDIVVPPQLLCEAAAELPDALVHHHHVLDDGWAQLCGQLLILQERTSNTLKGLQTDMASKLSEPPISSAVSSHYCRTSPPLADNAVAFCNTAPLRPSVVILALPCAMWQSAHAHPGYGLSISPVLATAQTNQ